MSAKPILFHNVGNIVIACAEFPLRHTPPERYSIPKRFTNLVALTRNNNPIPSISCRPHRNDYYLIKKKKGIYREEVKIDATIPRYKKKERERRIRDNWRSGYNKRNLKIGALISLLYDVLEQQTARDFLRKRAFCSFP